MACSAERRCERAFEGGDFVRAAPLCEKAYNDTPHVHLLALAAESHSQLLNPDEVERLCAPLLKTPRRPQALYLLGVATADRGQRDEAKTFFEKAYAEALEQSALAHAPKNQRAASRAAFQLASLSLSNNKLEESASWVQRGLHEAKASADFKTEVFLLEMLHRIELWLGNELAAENALAAAEALHWQKSQSPQAQHLLLARAFQSLEQERWALAEQQFLRLLNLSEGKPCDYECLFAWYGLARTRLYQGQPDKAEAALNEHLRLSTLPASPDVLLLRAQLADEQKNPAKVLDVLNEAQHLKLTDNEHQWVAVLRGNALAGLGRKKEAEAVLNEVVQQLEGMHKALVAPEQRSSFLRTRRWAFEWLFETHMEEGRVFEALEVAERLMAPTFMELLSAKLAPGLNAAEVHALLARAEQTDVKVAAEAPKLSVEKALELLSRDEFLLFFSSGEKFYRLWFHEGKLKELRSLPWKELKPRIEAFSLSPSEPQEAEALGAFLWPQGLSRGTHVQLVGQEAVRRLPWAALRVQGEWLAARHAVAWAPSLKVAALLHARARHEGDIVVVGNPTGDLPHAQLEALQVAQRLNAAPFLGVRAQRSVFERLSGAQLLHLAAHTSLEAQGASISLADGKLYAHEVLQSGLAPQTVVLASCASARSRDGEGLMSLGGSFLAAGSRQVVASLRSVGDAVSAEFMQHFYAEGGLEAPAWALAKAQMKMADHAPVEQWSAFVLWGTTR